MLNNKLYSFYKSKKIFRHVYKRYKRKKKTFSDSQKKRFENILLSLQRSLLNKNKKAADRAAKNLEKLSSIYLKKSFLEKFLDTVLALGFALLIAICVRQMFFEPYIIPTGSMRPTLKEKDLVIASKTNFSINVPLMQKHFYFNNKLLKRGAIVVFSAANLNIQDPDMLYFYLIPGKKQFVKRLIGKPGDVLYFYGGRIYGVDKNDDEIKDFYDESFTQIEHIPFINFEGQVYLPSHFSQEIYSPVMFYQMNEPIGLLNISPMSQVEGDFITNYSSVFTEDSKIDNYYDIWGFNNFAMARILSKEDFDKYNEAQSFKELIENAPLYLELIHHPTLKNAKIARDETGKLRPSLNYSKSFIPLDENNAKKIFENLYTARFYVKNGYAYNYNSNIKSVKNHPKLSDVKDGCYEIQNGKAYQVNFLGITKKLKDNHPLNTFSFEKTKLLFNSGIEFFNIYNSNINNLRLFPSRYAYFRNQDFYLMGKLILKKDDITILNYLQREYRRQYAYNHYKPFEDAGSPLSLYGIINKEKIKKYGIKIPDKMYLVLGDNHAMSADSRVFGFVPEDNLKGQVSFLFWPISNRWGFPLQPENEIPTAPTIFLFSITLLIAAIIYFHMNSQIKKPLKF